MPIFILYIYVYVCMYVYIYTHTKSLSRKESQWLGICDVAFKILLLCKLETVRRAGTENKRKDFYDYKYKPDI